jgi:cobalt-zinc-cadmium efflux system membrane fusion protein
VAPLAGEVTRREVTIGMGVEGGAPLFEIVDASTLWAELDVAELDLVHLQVGARAAITLDTLPERVFEGSVSYIAPTVSLSTRTALVRVPLDNADRALRGNMYGSGEITVSDALPSVTVPASAVQRAKGVDLVFVRFAEDEYEARRVKLRSRQGDLVRLSGGVKPGEAVVTLGSFLLKTETLKDSIGAGCCDVE